MTEKPRILLTGASGTVGLEVLKLLHKQVDRIELVVFDVPCKRSRNVLSAYSKNVEIIYGDISNPLELRSACSNISFVIHLAAIIPPLADDDPELAYRVNTLGTENLVKHLEELSPEAFFIYSSSISVYGDRLKEPGIRIGDPMVASLGDEYAKTKIAAEKIIQGSSLDWTILRLTAIMGNHSDTKLMFHMPLATSMEIATPSDTGRAFVNALEKREELSRKIFNLGGGESCRSSYREFLSRSYDIFGLGKLDFPLKAFAEKNFHCGFYEDGEVLENILKFRRDNLDDYFKHVDQSTPRYRKVITSIFKYRIKKGMLKQSEPYDAFTSNDLPMIQRYFN